MDPLLIVGIVGLSLVLCGAFAVLVVDKYLSGPKPKRPPEPAVVVPDELIKFV